MDNQGGSRQLHEIATAGRNNNGVKVWEQYCYQFRVCDVAGRDEQQFFGTMNQQKGVYEVRIFGDDDTLFVFGDAEDRAI